MPYLEAAAEGSGIGYDARFGGVTVSIATVVEEETSKMPIQTSILDHDVLGPLFQKGNRKGG